MNLSVDFLNAERRTPNARVWLVVAAILFAISLAAFLRSHSMVKELNRELIAAKYDLSDSKRRGEEAARVASAEVTGWRMLDRYAASLPWAEVLDAVESVPSMRVTVMRFDVEAGDATVEVVGLDDGELIKGVEYLRQALPRWRLRVVQHDQVDGRIALSLKLQDELRPSIDVGNRQRN